MSETSKHYRCRQRILITMKLRPRLLVTAVAVALPLTILLFMVNEHLRARDRRLTLERVVASQLTDDTRERCEANPNWFLAGPRPDRPSAEVLAAPDADVNAPRPPTQVLPFEFFAYDEAFSPLSSAGPRFPPDLRQMLRADGVRTAIGEFSTAEGTGLQAAIVTGWDRSRCAVLLYRLHPVPRQAFERGWMVLALFGALLTSALIAAGPTILRVRRLGLEARQSASDEYRSTISVGGRDELSALAFAFNEAGADIRRRATDVRDREESLRRYLASVAESGTLPLLALEQRLSELARDADRAKASRAVIDAHTLAMRIQNLSAAATLRMSLESAARDAVELNALIDRVVARHAPFSRAADVGVTAAVPPEAITIRADTALVEQAVSNLVDNAIRYNRAGGQVTIRLERLADRRFSLRVADDGPGAPDEVLAKLNANRRFRGDEGKSGRPGELGLGLAIVREVSDRFGLHWAFRKNSKGWFEAEVTGS
jgi:signal transduction histidine kinase